MAGFVVLACAGAATARAQSQPCAPVDHASHSYVVCKFDAATDAIEIRRTGRDGAPLLNFDRLSADVAKSGSSLIFAMNAGMYHSDRSPVGLLIENGVTRSALNTSRGFGNFYLKPNGVFYLAGGRAGVLETSVFRQRAIAPDYATQSGPMLLIDGKLHPRFLRDASSRNIRNGVGVAPDGRKVAFVISNTKVTFYEFASFFRDVLGMRDALYLDGSISRLHATALGRNDPGEDMGPVVFVTTRDPTQQHGQKDPAP